MELPRKIKILACRISEEPQVEEIEDTLDALQKFVGGYFEMLHISDDIALYLCDSGRFSKPYNRSIFSRAPNISPDIDVVIEVGGPFAAPGEVGRYDLYGNFFVGRSSDEGELIDLTDEDVKRYSELLSLGG